MPMRFAGTDEERWTADGGTVPTDDVAALNRATPAAKPSHSLGCQQKAWTPSGASVASPKSCERFAEVAGSMRKLCDWGGAPDPGVKSSV